jgi:hypothetical protein
MAELGQLEDASEYLFPEGKDESGNARCSKETSYIFITLI